jgi:hypothetical protein
MPRKPDVPCAGCGKMLWSAPRSLPAGERMCKECRADPPAVEDEPAETCPLPAWVPGAGLGPRGRALWREMDGARLDVSRRVLLEETCRLADRCDQLDTFLRGHGDTWLKFHARNEDGSIVQVVVDKALTEARQQAATLKTLLADLRSKQEQPKPEASRRDELAKRREDRRRAAGL